MAYSSGLPILYLFGFFCFLFLYITDKIMVLVFLKKPPNYNCDLHERVIGILKYVPLVHSIISVVVFGNTLIYQ